MPSNKGAGYQLGRDLDLDSEEFIFDGERLTDERAEQIAQKALRELRARNLVPGRKSLSGTGVHSPRINVRLPEDVHAELQRQARAVGESVSKLTREVLSAFVADAAESDREIQRLRNRVDAGSATSR